MSQTYSSIETFVPMSVHRAAVVLTPRLRTGTGPWDSWCRAAVKTKNRSLRSKYGFIATVPTYQLHAA